MTQPSIGPEQRKADALNADMRKGWATGDYEQTIEAHHRRLNAENIDLRGQLDMARKATSAAQELLEAERQKNARLEAQMATAWNAYQTHAIELPRQLSAALGQEKLLRVNDAATIADLERRLREAQGQLRQQREVKPPLMGPAIGMMEIPAALWREKMAETTELRRTLGMVGKYLDELKELVGDPANPNGKP